MHDLQSVVKSINSFVGRYGCILHIIEIFFFVEHFVLATTPF